MSTLFHHLALPPQLPGKSDTRTEQLEAHRVLMARLISATRHLTSATTGEAREAFDCIRRSLENSKHVNYSDRLNKSSLLDAFRRLERDEVLILHVGEQNAGLLIRRDDDTAVIFEAFELSPTAEQVLASNNALQWDFPGSAVSIPYSTFKDYSFQENIAAFLEQASSESIKQFSASSYKAGSAVVEIRDTVQPSLITQMLMSLLWANGTRVYPPLLRKRVRDDVCWANAETPWRRSPFWLLLRVAVQRHLCHRRASPEQESGRVYYKILQAVVLCTFLTDSLGNLIPESCDFLKRKICRRLVKLQQQKLRAPDRAKATYESMFAIVGPFLEKTISDTNAKVDSGWRAFKAKVQRHIPVRPGLPRRADPRDLTLTLPNSASYLHKVLSRSFLARDNVFLGLVHVPMAVHKLKAFADRCYSLAGLEEFVIDMAKPGQDDFDFSGPRCLSLAATICRYLDEVKMEYRDNAEEMSTVILNVMYLWVAMDICALKTHRLLEEYMPIVRPETLDVLQLASAKNMVRLQYIQRYLGRRVLKCSTRRTLFDEPIAGCFAERYFNESDDRSKLEDLDVQIEVHAAAKREEKKQQWETLSAQYETLMQQIASSSCMYTPDDVYPFKPVHDDKCTKCYLDRCSRRMKIEVYEEPLPSADVLRKAVIFELGIPQVFAHYRDATSKILLALSARGVDAQTAAPEPRVHLYSYSQLTRYVGKRYNVSLASTKKSFLTSHWATVRLPVALDQVCRPNGLDFSYYDSAGTAWLGKQHRRPSFAHLCGIRFPPQTPFAKLQKEPAYAADADGLSSYEILAKQTKCPPGLNTNEFMAYQSLFSGKDRRWLVILTELGSSNLNFSAESTALLFNYLALQAGPCHQSDILRSVHIVFKDKSFCSRLLEVITYRLDNISSNWREIYAMELLLTLGLRLHALGPASVKTGAVEYILKARHILFAWTRALRMDMRLARDAESYARTCRYSFWAGLLCRRTFAIWTDDELLDSDALTVFIEASITMHDSLPGDPANFPLSLKNALTRDLKCVHRARHILLRSMKRNPHGLESAINNIWPQAQGAPRRQFSDWEPVSPPYDFWVQSTIQATEFTRPVHILYNLLEGLLQIDGKPLGRMSPEEMKTAIMTELFGNQNPLTYPSDLPGMTYTLALIMDGHQIHIGFRDHAGSKEESIFVRARVGNTVLELVPRTIFKGLDNFDLPVPLVENCIHWLDLRNGWIEIRQKPHIWRSRTSNWILDFYSRCAFRRNVRLVDPHSQLFQRVADMFKNFEYRSQLTIYQPKVASLTVEMKRLELRFSVNRKFLLQSKQLGSEIDPNQDAGTWYGLESMLVLRDIFNSANRSILVPMGGLKYKRNGIHVSVILDNNGIYGRYSIDSILGRVNCPTESWLLYRKAELHAYTSFVIPDPLTGRTGTEEALHCLTSGYCQPWAPLHSGPYHVLASIANLVPVREYYPKDLKRQQTVRWDPELTVTIQDEAFRSVIEEICRRSKQLSEFAFTKTELQPLKTSGDPDLRLRALFRRSLHHRAASHSVVDIKYTDLAYKPRDQLRDTQRTRVIYESVRALLDRSTPVHATNDLASILQKWPNIGGYDRVFDKVLLSDRLAVDFAIEWGSLVRLCKDAGADDTHRLMFVLGAIAYGKYHDMDIVRVLIAFAVLPDLKSLVLPSPPCFSNFQFNQAPKVEHLALLIKNFYQPPRKNEQENLGFRLSSKQRKMMEAAAEKRIEECEKAGTAFAEFLVRQWPCSEVSIEGAPLSDCINHEAAMAVIRPEWLRLYQNLELSQHVEDVQRMLRFQTTAFKFEMPTGDGPEPSFYPSRAGGGELPSLMKDLLRQSGPILKDSDATQPQTPAPSGAQHSPQDTSRCKEIVELEAIIEGLTASDSTIRKQYGNDLKQSLGALELVNSKQQSPKTAPNEASLNVQLSEAKHAVSALRSQISLALEPDNDCVVWLKLGGLWPSIGSVSLLETLRSTSDVKFGQGMKESLIAYAVSLTKVQRLARMVEAGRKGNTEKLLEEVKNRGHGNWRPSDYPDWLLLELEANMLIREAQVDVALATISPNARSNSVLQMNMGQGKWPDLQAWHSLTSVGKTSCIMPMAAAVLADSERLVRLIVPKALLHQTSQMMQSRLGGLLGRQVRHVPFARRTPTTAGILKLYHEIHKDMLRASGIILALPEHLLSFMLSGPQRLSDKRLDEATQMIKVQAWLRRVCRDVLDESDYTLAVRTQLIYPSGSQLTVDGHPHRWTTAEALLTLVEGHLLNLQIEFPKSIEVVKRPKGGFPFMHFLRKDVEQALLDRLVEDVSVGKTSILPTRDLSHDDQAAIKSFITMAHLDHDISERINRLFSDEQESKRISMGPSKQNLYLLRGLLVHRILLLCLKRRWNVHYGLHPARDPIAVPFHAKGVPSEQAEWGHPDVAILFTCLAFYYTGLTLEQLCDGLQHLLKSDDPSSQYDRWTHSCKTLPDSLREWTTINVDDKVQTEELWEHLRFTGVVVDYYLNHFVFPKHAKQFRVKLTASGWDIPLFGIDKPKEDSARKLAASKSSRALTTGFSGTNDNRRLLPLTIKQHDLPTLAHTNAEVLTYLLQPRNRKYLVVADRRGKHLSEVAVLRLLCDMKIRVFIDAGAQVLEMDNKTVARQWLVVDAEAPAAVYFDDENKAWVLHRNGAQVPLLASPFADDLTGCLVYLDEAHTRGTDLKMPPSARGALTLGAGQTKDHTVQAAMRMRQLGSSQSIVFLAPPEVHQSILDLRGKTERDFIDSHDVICWLLEQTCAGNEQLQPLYFSQGADFCRRIQAACDNPDFLEDPDQCTRYVGALRQREQQTLQQLYGPVTRSKSAPSGPWNAELATFMKELNKMRRGFQDTGDAVHGSALQEVEQEREVAFEVESVREVQKLIHFSPLSFPGLHKDVRGFARTGRLPPDSQGYMNAFMALKRTGIGSKYGIVDEAMACQLYVSSEFTKTVLLPHGHVNDNFIRPVNWLLWSPAAESALIVIPEEAELLLPLLRSASPTATHLLTYAAPVTRKMLHFNDLTYYGVPSLPAGWKAPAWLTVAIGIFAGRLYFDFEEYAELRRFLGLLDAEEGPVDTLETSAGTESGFLPTVASEPDASPGESETPDSEQVETDQDGDEKRSNDDQVASAPRQVQRRFSARPMTFLQEWLALRRRGQDFAHTPMGYMCQGKALTAGHPFFARTAGAGGRDVVRGLQSTGNTGNTGAQSGGLGDDDDFDSDASAYDGYSASDAQDEDDEGGSGGE